MEDNAAARPAIPRNNIVSTDKAQEQCEQTLRSTWYNMYDSHLHITEGTVKVERIDEGSNEAISESVNNTCNEDIRETELYVTKVEVKVEFNNEEDLISNTEDVPDEKHIVKSELGDINERQEVIDYSRFNIFKEKNEIESKSSGVLGNEEKAIDKSSKVCEIKKQRQMRRNNSPSPLRKQRTRTLSRCKKEVTVLSKQLTGSALSIRDDENEYDSLIQDRIISGGNDINVSQKLTNSKGTFKALKYENTTTDNYYVSDPCNVNQTISTRTSNTNSDNLIPNTESDTESLKNLFICDICKGRFHCKSSLLQHILKHPKVYNCTYCGYETKKQGNLNRHINAKHTKTTVYNCCYCSYKAYQKIHIDRHINSQHIKTTVFNCSYCSYKAYQKIHIDRHINSQHVKSTSFKCSSCSYKTNDKRHLDRHIISQHTKRIVLNCSDCSYKTYDESTLKRHIQIRHTVIVFNCTYCSYKTHYKTDFNRHVNAKHTKSTVFKCSYCNFITYRKLDLDKHTNSQHTKSTVFKCSYCGHKTYDKDNLNKHINSQHTKRTVFNCSYCNYKSYHKRGLSLHINNIHAKRTTVLKCPYCSYITYRKFDLNKHTESQHPKSAIYHCTYCSHKTHRKWNLNQHINSQHIKSTMFNCSDCSFQTLYRQSLNKHVKVKHS